MRNSAIRIGRVHRSRKKILNPNYSLQNKKDTPLSRGAFYSLIDELLRKINS